MITNWQEQRERLVREAAEREELRKRSDAKPMGILTKAGHYMVSTAKWVRKGAPERNDEEVNQIIEICKACPQGYFKDGVCTHRSCGCNVMSANDEKVTLVGIVLGRGMANKLRRATEHCPIGEW